MEPKSWRALDEVHRTCGQVGAEQWRTELAPRLTEKCRRLPTDREMMRIFTVAIAYSQNVRAKQVSILIETDQFRQAFADFDPDKLAAMKPFAIRKRYWARLGSMRIRSKVNAIVRCAKVLREIQEEFGSFARYLRSFKIPQRLKSDHDLAVFWKQFILLRRDLRKREMPFFRSTTSLLQLLLDLDFDSVKPDVIVMRLARRIDLVEGEGGERHLRSATREIQRYAIERGLRARAVDLMILAFGGQTGARDLLARRFCPPTDPCGNASCPLARKSLCEAFSK